MAEWEEEYNGIETGKNGVYRYPFRYERITNLTLRVVPFTRKSAKKLSEDKTYIRFWFNVINLLNFIGYQKNCMLGQRIS